MDIRNLVLVTVRLCGGGLFFLFHFRALALLWFSWNARRIQVVLALSFLIFSGLLAGFSLQGYPIFFLSVLVGGCAAGPMAAIARALASRDSSWSELWITAITCYRKYLGILALACGLLLPFALYPLLRHRDDAVLYGPTISIPVTLVVALLVRYLAGRALAVRLILGRRFALSVAATLVLVACLGAARHTWNMFLPCSNVLDGGRLASLEHLRDSTGPGTLLTTSRHDVGSSPDGKQKSYLIAAAAQRYAFPRRVGILHRADGRSPRISAHPGRQRNALFHVEFQRSPLDR